MTTALTRLRQRLAELTDLRHADQLLQWDQQTMMPPRGALSRADALGTLGRISHQQFIAAETGHLLQAAAQELRGADPDSDDARLVSVMTRRWEKARRVPTELAAELARASSLGHEAWVGARERSDFAAFAPFLVRNIELARRYTECFDTFEAPYDALLDDYEPGMRSATVAAVFDELKTELVTLNAALKTADRRVDDSPVNGHFPEADQRRLVAEVLGHMGYSPEGWRMDVAAHPFASSFGNGDVRITTRWDESYFPAGLFGAMHECGHGLYEEGIAQSLQRTPLGHAESLALHESQSRLWENMVGRGRPFCGFLAGRVAATFGGSLTELDGDTLYRAVNRVQPSFIRVEADEATYNLHIVLRFELEQALVDGRLSVDELPDAWNQRMADFFGLQVVDDADGVLQDVHWAAGLIGYFPTYALGNLIAGQLWQRAHADLPDLDAQLAAGELAVLREWLREYVHRHGAKFSMSEMLQRTVGGGIAVTPFVSYLRAKLGDVYGIALQPGASA